jgi:predicted DCC family thiol-disulfide oxidoreductase YuxK
MTAEICRLTVLYDPDCPLCSWVRDWLERRPQYVPLDFVPLGSEQARATFPALDHARTREEVTVVADTGEVWTADGAWLAVLWATVDYRSLAERLSGPQARGQVRRVALSLAASRMGRPAPPACTPDGACAVPARPASA